MLVSTLNKKVESTKELISVGNIPLSSDWS